MPNKILTHIYPYFGCTIRKNCKRRNYVGLLLECQIKTKGCLEAKNHDMLVLHVVLHTDHCESLGSRGGLSDSTLPNGKWDPPR